jgi:glyoxylase-like metal-dependent hydrolase (beta-lactamase superfamily II)
MNNARVLILVVIMFTSLIMIGCGAAQKSVSITTVTESAVTFQLGRFVCTVVKDGGISINAFDFFSGVDSPKMRAAFEEDGLNPEAVPLSLQILVVDTGEDLVLIDTGLGEPVGADEGRLIEYLGELGIAPEEVNVVIITHGHWDHIGGIVDKEGRLQFPNARHVMSKKAWEYWTSEENLSHMSEQLVKWARENLPPLKEKVELVELDSEILPGIVTMAAPGHTPGQLAVLVKSGSQKLLCLADAAHNPVQMEHPEIGYSGDMDQEKARSTRWTLVELSMNERFLVYGCHFPFPGLGYVEEKNGERQWSELKAE